MDFSQEGAGVPDPLQPGDGNDQSQEEKAVEKMKTTSLPNDSQHINDQTVVSPPVQRPQEAGDPQLIQNPSVDQDKTLQEPAVDQDKTLRQPVQGMEAPPPSSFNYGSSPNNNYAPGAMQQGYSPTEQIYPQPGQIYPPAGVSNLPSGQNYPPAGQTYPQSGPSYFPSGQNYPPAGVSNLPSGQNYPPVGQTYPQSGPSYFPSGQNYAQPVYKKPADKKPPKPLGRLGHPLPLWAFLAGIGLIIILLLVLHLTGSDWGDGSANASHAAAAIGVLLLLALIVRSWNGMTSTLNPNRRRQYIASFLCIIIIFVYSGVSLALVPTLHGAQGQSLAGQQQWQKAINEYTLAGEKAPDGTGLAQVYTSWGLALNKTQHYNEALTKFNVVMDQFNSVSTKDQVGKAQSGSIDARLALSQQSMQAKNYAAASSSYDTLLNLLYCKDTCRTKAQSGSIDARLGLGQQSMQAKDYVAASSTYDTLLNLPYCNDTCHQQVASLDATAYYNQGESHLQAKEYDNASTAFDVVLTKFPSAPEAKQLHGDMAKALLGGGKQTRTSSCSAAIPTYQRLSNEYGDTPEGQAAKQDLNAPQTITGKFSNIEPNIDFNQMGLAQGLHGLMVHDELFNAWNAAGQKTGIQANGDFSFSNIAQGDYDLFWHGIGGDYEYVEFIYSETTLTPTYVAHVGPLCPVDMGQVTNVQGTTIPQ